ncbi:MAG: DUF3786 domain-containing protein [Thermodesulfobacteriota bacterium]
MPRIDDYKNALEIARREFKEKNPQRIAENSGAEFETGKGGAFFHLPFLNRKLRITWPEGEVIVPEGTKELSLQEQGLVMHYLIQASGSPLTRTWITFREIPSGEFYFSAFVKRAKDPLVQTFGPDPQRLIKIGKTLGGTEGTEGDASLYFQVFPRIPIGLILWAGDEEFPPDGNLLFDAGIARYLSAEDVAVLSGMVVYPLIGLAQKKGINNQE